MEGSDTDHKTLQSPGTERRDKGRSYSFPEPHPWLNYTEFGHLVSVSVRKEKKKKFYLKDTRSVATGHGSYNK